jgi:zinc transporter ZupT
LRLRDRLHLVLGFSAGAVIGVAFFDLLPEALAIGGKYYAVPTLLTWAAVGFFAYLILDRAVLYYGLAAQPDKHHSDRAEHAGHSDHSDHAPAHGALGAASLSAHSYLDGLAIGFAFQTSTALGAIVTMGVLTHDFSDGINTMNLVLKNGGSRRDGLRWVVVDALAPAAGIGSSAVFAIPEQLLGVVLAVFFGFFLYIGASDFIPESHHAHPKILTTTMTLVGAAVIYAAVLLIR